MLEKIIKGIKYCLNEETMTAEVIAKRNGYEGDIIIPETVVFKKVSYLVTNIDEHAFYNCKSLKIIAIPSNAIIVERGAFFDCDSLRAIRYGGTAEQWHWRYMYWDDYSFHKKTVHCIDGDVTIR